MAELQFPPLRLILYCKLHEMMHNMIPCQTCFIFYVHSPCFHFVTGEEILSWCAGDLNLSCCNRSGKRRPVYRTWRWLPGALTARRRRRRKRNWRRKKNCCSRYFHRCRSHTGVIIYQFYESFLLTSLDPRVYPRSKVRLAYWDPLSMGKEVAFSDGAGFELRTSKS